MASLLDTPPPLARGRARPALPCPQGARSTPPPPSRASRRRERPRRLRSPAHLASTSQSGDPGRRRTPGRRHPAGGSVWAAGAQRSGAAWPAARAERSQVRKDTGGGRRWRGRRAGPTRPSRRAFRQFRRFRRFRPREARAPVGSTRAKGDRGSVE